MCRVGRKTKFTRSFSQSWCLHIYEFRTGDDTHYSSIQHPYCRPTY